MLKSIWKFVAVTMIASVAIVALAACGSSEPAPPPQQSANSGANVGGKNTVAPAAPAAAAPAAAAPAPAAPAAAAAESATTITAVLDNVGAAQFRMSKGIWPDVMFHGYYGFLAVSYTHLTLPTICSV